MSADERRVEKLRQRLVEKIRQRHEAFVAQYSPGPDWEPCNTMSEDRGWLLARIDALTARLHEAHAALAELVDSCAYPEFDDVRLEYISVQIDRPTLAHAKALLTPPPTPGKEER